MNSNAHCHLHKFTKYFGGRMCLRSVGKIYATFICICYNYELKQLAAENFSEAAEQKQ